MPMQWRPNGTRHIGSASHCVVASAISKSKTARMRANREWLQGAEVPRNMGPVVYFVQASRQSLPSCSNALSILMAERQQCLLAVLPMQWQAIFILSLLAKDHSRCTQSYIGLGWSNVTGGTGWTFPGAPVAAMISRRGTDTQSHWGSNHSHVEINENIQKKCDANARMVVLPGGMAFPRRLIVGAMRSAALGFQTF